MTETAWNSNADLGRWFRFRGRTWYDHKGEMRSLVLPPRHVCLMESEN